MRRIAIVEDDAATATHLIELLETLENVEVVRASDKQSADTIVSAGNLNLAILDVDLGSGPANKYAGLSLLGALNHQGCTVIVVSGMPEGNLKGISLSLNAYEFIGKPIDDIDFLNKVEHALAWTSSPATRPTHRGTSWPRGLTVDETRAPSLLWEGKPVRLTLTELKITYCLIETPGVTVDSARLTSAMQTAASAAALANHILGVRRKFIDVDSTFQQIQAEPGRGYVWKTDNE